MKKQKKNMGSLIKKAGVKGMAAGAVSLVLVAGGFMFYGKIIRGVTCLSRNCL
nr:hypothetical protein [Clostridium sp. OM04-12AA]